MTKITINTQTNGIKVSSSGTPGRDGKGLPPGGTPGQILMKNGTEDHETQWVNQTSTAGEWATTDW